MIKKLSYKIQGFLDRMNVIYLRLVNIFANKYALNVEQVREKKIIISLTTYPKRFDVVHITLETIFRQTFKPDMIILYLSKDELRGYPIPDYILKLKKRGLTIKLVDKNLKSYNKLIYVLEEYPNEILITVDDDILYSRYLLEKLYEQHIQYPKEIIAYRCSLMSKEFEKKLSPYLSWKNAKNIKKPSYNLFFTGVGGVLYPPNSLHKEVLNKSKFLKLAPLADDVWFKAMSLKNNTKVVQVFEDFIEFPIINEKSQQNALWKINNGLNKNDEQIKKVFDYYNLYKYIS